MKYIWMVVCGIIWLGALFDAFKSIKHSIELLGHISITDWYWSMKDLTKAWFIINIVLLTIYSFIIWIMN